MNRLITIALAVAGAALLTACGSSALVEIDLLTAITAGNVASISELAILPNETDWIHSVNFSPDDQTLVVTSEDGTTRIWEVMSGKENDALRAHTGAVSDAVFSPDGSILVSAGTDGNALVWEAKTGRGLDSMVSTTGNINGISFSPDGKYIAFVTGQLIFLSDESSPNTSISLQLWDAETYTRLMLIPSKSIELRVQFSHDSSMLATSDSDGLIIIWDVADGSLVERTRLEGHEINVRGLAFSPDGTMLASGDNNGEVRLWDIATGESLFITNEHSNWVTDIAFSPDGTFFISGGNDGTIRFWDIATGEILATHTIELAFEEKADNWVTSVSFNSDGTLLAVGVGHLGHSTVRLWGISPE